MQIEFAADMPVAAVEVIAPDLSVVARTMLSPGQSREVDISPADSFLRVHLPDGSVAILDEPGRLNHFISRATLQSGSAATAAPEDAEIQAPPALKHFTALDLSSLPIAEASAGTLEATRSEFAPARASVRRHAARRPQVQILAAADSPVQLARNSVVQLLGVPKAVVKPRRGGVDYLLPQRSRFTELPFTLSFNGANDVAVDVSLPASAQAVSVQLSGRSKSQRLRISLRSHSPHADAILGYLARGDMYAATALAEWTDEAEQLVYRDESDPYSGVVGAYLLLRLRDFGRMRDWVRQIAEQFDFLSDGSILWAWQLVHMKRGESREARDWFFKACDLPLPVYSEGLRLLLDGLCLFGKDGERMTAKVMERAADVVLDSPLLTRVRIGNEASARPPVIEIDFQG